jgi:preprotein translocase subunit YajC
MSILFILPLLLVGYFLLVRPQQQQVRRQRDLVSSLQVGAEVQTAGGIVGRIIDLDDQFVQLQVGPGTVITFIRGSVQKVISLPDSGASDLGAPEPGDQPYGNESIDLSEAEPSAGPTAQPGPLFDTPADQAGEATTSLPVSPPSDPPPPPQWSAGTASEGTGEDAEA